MSDAYVVFAWNAAGFIVQAVVCLMLIPKLWKPEMPFGVSVPAGQGREKVEQALAYWRRNVLGITAAALAMALMAAFSSHPERYSRLAPFWQILYTAAVYMSYGRARRLVLPLSAPSTVVSVPLRQRRYHDYLSPWWEVLPLSLIVAAIVVAVLADPLVLSVKGVTTVLFLMPSIYLMNVAFAILTVRSKQSAGGGDPETALAASDALRRAWLRWAFVVRSLIALGHLLLALSFTSGNWKTAGDFARLPLFLCLVLMVAAIAVGALVIQMRYGQGGWRWAVRKGLVAPDKVGPMLDGDGMQDKHWKLGMFYYNREDPSFLVERRFGVGWTLNLGNTTAMVLCAIILCLMLLPALIGMLHWLWRLWLKS